MRSEHVSEAMSSTVTMVAEQSVARRRRGRHSLFGPGERGDQHEHEAAFLQDLLTSKAPPPVAVLVRRMGEGWLSVLITDLPHRPEEDGPASQFLSQWRGAVARCFDCRGGDGQVADGSDLHPDTPWDHHWVRYEVRHLRGHDYW